MANQTVRKSNLEALRIVAMFLVLFIHYIPTRMVVSPETIRSNFWSSIGQLELQSISFVCVNCFVLITGYFGIKWKLKSFSRLIYIIAFWAGISWICSRIIPLISIFSGEHIEGNPISLAFTQRWFIGAYICLYVIAPIINSFIEKCTQQQLGRYIIIFLLFSTVYGWLLKSGNFNEGMSELHLAGLYLIGAYIRRYDLKCLNLRASTDLILYFVLGFVLVIINAATYYIGFDKSIYGYLNPIIILQSIYLFLFFKKLDIGYVPVINIIAASTFSAYLFHHHLYIFPIYNQVCEWMNSNSPLPILSMTCVIFLIIGFCTIIDFIGNRLFNLLYNHISYIYSISSLLSKRYNDGGVIYNFTFNYILNKTILI